MSLHRFITRLLIVALMIALFTCCKSSKSIQTSSEVVEIEEKKDIKETIETTEEIEWYDGIMSGTLPVTYPKETQDTLVFNLESRGIDLDLFVTKNGITYNAKAKPTASIKKTEKIEREDNTETTTKSEKEEEKIKEKESPFKPSTFFWIILALGIVFLGYLNRKRFVS